MTAGSAAPHGGQTDSQQRAPRPLTALEWLRVTHAGTLSGRRIAESRAAAEARGRAEAAAKIAAVAANYEDEANDEHHGGYSVGVDLITDLRALAAELSAPGGPR